MREFCLKNSNEEVRELQYGDQFLWLPSGLGYGNANEYADMQGFFYDRTSLTDQLSVNGTFVFFPPNAYAKYQDLFNWILTSDGLELGYKPINTWYYRRISIDNVEKTELTRNGALEVPVQIMPLSPYFATVNKEISIDASAVTDAKVYNYKYPYKYAYSSAIGQFSETITAQMDCDFSIEFIGQISSPTLTVSTGGEIIGKVDLTGISADSGEAIVFNNVAGTAGVKLIDVNTRAVLANYDNYININGEYPNFFKIPSNVLCDYSIGAASLVGLKANVTFYSYYRTV